MDTDAIRSGRSWLALDSDEIDDFEGAAETALLDERFRRLDAREVLPFTGGGLSGVGGTESAPLADALRETLISGTFLAGLDRPEGLLEGGTAALATEGGSAGVLATSERDLSLLSSFDDWCPPWLGAAPPRLLPRPPRALRAPRPPDFPLFVARVADPDSPLLLQLPRVASVWLVQDKLPPEGAGGGSVDAIGSNMGYDLRVFPM